MPDIALVTAVPQPIYGKDQNNRDMYSNSQWPMLVLFGDAISALPIISIGVGGKNRLNTSVHTQNHKNNRNGLMQ